MTRSRSSNIHAQPVPSVSRLRCSRALVSRGALCLALVSAPGAALVGCGFQDPDEAAVAPAVHATSIPQVVGTNSSGVGQLNTAGVLPPPAVSAAGADTSLLVGGPPPKPVSTTPDADCGSNSQSAGLKPVVLMFNFDVSGSMGDMSFSGCYDPKLKWQPVVAAAKAFFADTASNGLSAALTFFPGEDPSGTAPPPGMGGGNGNQYICQATSYAKADVPLTALPSPVFAAALDAVDPILNGVDWRSGTPTGPGLEGTVAQIKELRLTQPNNNYVIVLVTDGQPAVCGAQIDSLDSVANILEAAAADGIATYVIGVDNPPTPTVTTPAPAASGAASGSAAPPVGIPPGGGGGGAGGQCAHLAGNLDALAVAGGAMPNAMIIDTGDPLKTAADFKEAISKIRDENLACEVTIPKAPDGKNFSKDEVNVAYKDSTGADHALVYDASCAAADAWHYDNETTPTSILLCESTCTAVQGQVTAELNIAFGCETKKPLGT